jgi:hypothetical protein
VDRGRKVWLKTVALASDTLKKRNELSLVPVRPEKPESVNVNAWFAFKCWMESKFVKDSTTGG